MNRKIVCDTMIWYYLGNNILDISEFNNDSLIATRLNIYELANTPNLYKDFNYYRNAIIALKKYSSFIILESPIDYLVNRGHEKYSFDNSSLNNILSAFDRLISLPQDFDSSQIDMSDFKKGVESLRINPSKLTDAWNDLLPEVRANIKAFSNKRIWRSIDSTCYIKQFIKKIIRRDFFVNFNTYDWQSIDFFVGIWDLYYKELELCASSKIKVNDWPDIYNLVYVRPEYYYLTCEAKWYNIAGNNKKLQERIIFKTVKC